jgi:hypothetical protein
MAKVYVSSTIADLEAERQAVIDWLVAARHQPVHSYVVSSDTVRDSCLADVDTCDLYVLILGHRYGFQPPRDNPEGLSITHLEFRQAGQSGIPRVALLRMGVPGRGAVSVEETQQAALVDAFRAEVTDAVRAGQFGDLAGLIQGLSTGVQAELDKLPRGGRVLRLGPRPPFLAGREDLLADLDGRLAAGADRQPRMVALHGLAGAGKTSVALAYAHDHLREAGVVWQVAAEDPAVLAAGFGELAAALGAGEGSGDPVAAVHGALAARRDGWLLVFDNAPGPEAVRGLVPPAGNGRVLVTSRNALWPPGQAVEVAVLDLDAAAGFLTARTGDTDRQAAAGLAEAVGGLPLALEQAGAYIQATGDTLAGCLASFRRHRPDMLARGKAIGYDSTVAATWSLAFGELERSAPQAAGLLRLLACCAPEAIPLRLLLQPRPPLTGRLGDQVAPVLVPLLEDELAPKDAIAALRHYSLVTPAGDGLVLVHRLVQHVTLAQLPADVEGQWQQAAAALVEAAIPADTEQPAAWPVCAVLLPHARAVLDPTSGGMWRIADYLGQSGSYPAARDLFQLIADARSEDEAYGPEHPDTLGARAEMARWAGYAGDAAGARDQYAALLPIVERVLGPEHPDTLVARSNLADWTETAGDAAGARDQYASLLPIQERVLGPEHPDTLVTRGNLAYCTGTAGDAAGARDQYAVLLPVRERVSGAEHLETLIVRGNLARWTGEAGDAAAARDQYAALLPIVERVLGAEHPVTLTTHNNLARWTGAAGDAAAARDQYAALLPIIERVLGVEHPEPLTVRGNLAQWTGETGDAAGARDQYAALPIRERVSGAEHPATLHAQNNLARWTGAAGDAAGARDQFTALLPIVERVLGPGHPATLTTRNNLAYWSQKADGAEGRGEN